MTRSLCLAVKTIGTSMLASVLALALASGLSTPVHAKEIEIKTLNRGPDGSFFAFAPEVVRIEPGTRSISWRSTRGTTSTPYPA